MVAELYRVTLPGGLVQVQTPRPWGARTPEVEGPYQTAHLVILSPPILARELESNGLRVIDRRLDPARQAYLCRKPPDAF